MQKNILLEKQKIVIVDGTPHLLPSTDMILPKSLAKASLKKWLRIALKDLYSKCFNQNDFLAKQVPEGGNFCWANFKIVYDVSGFDDFKDPEKLPSKKCVELYQAVIGKTFKFFLIGSETVPLIEHEV
jgi:hypothetical protein